MKLYINLNPNFKRVFFYFSGAVLFGIVFLSLSPAALAQTGIVPCDGIECNVCHLYEGTSRLINFLLFQITLPMAVVAIIAGGVIWLTSGGSENKVSLGREILWYAVLGLFLAFSGWVIVHTLLNTLGFRIPINGASWFDYSICQGLSTQTGQASAPLASIPGTPRPAPVGVRVNESAARAFLTQNGININKNPCPAGVNFQSVPGGCTSLEGMTQEALNSAVAFKNACQQFNPNCVVTINGGTEAGHAAGTCSHASGCKYDIAATPITTAFVRSLPPIGTRNDGAVLYQCPSGLVCAAEPGHFDVSI